MFLSQAEQKRRRREIERQIGITPEEKRRTEIKAGVINSCSGLGVTILLYVLMQGIILSGRAAGAEEILSRIWVAGTIPIFVGLALIINGVFVSKRHGDNRDALMRDSTFQPSDPNRQTIGTTFSVTEDTTKHLDKLDSSDRIS